MEAVLDACALIAFLRGEDGAEVVEETLAERACIMHAVNVCEVYKDCLSRGESTERADELLKDLFDIGLSVHEEIPAALWKKAAKIKSTHKLSYNDAYALAFSASLDATLFTSDRHELGIFEGAGEYAIRFIR